MRTGKNPAKDGLPAYTPHRLGVALIVYIPFTEGYFENSLEIFQYQIDSLRAATGESFDLLVFDNGSCQQAVSGLQRLYDLGQIDWLILSAHNMGKAGAWNWIFASMPNELICYADSDVLFRPGWLQASLQVMKAFPRAGMVGAQPNFYDVMAGEGQAHLELQGDKSYYFSDYWPDKDTIDEYCTGIGASEEIAAQFYSRPLPAITEQTSGVQAVIGASHMQFLIPKEVARQVVPLPSTRGLLRKETMSIDYKIDSLGYLHLSTQKPYVFHMGNTVNERLQGEVLRITGNLSPAVSAPKRAGTKSSTVQRWLTSLAKRPRFNRLFVRAYNLLFRALYTEALEK
jgi:glycosyltransferase involved in cell wall biosynthesis